MAEEVVFKDATTGAQDDLKRATEIAREMVCEYGMSEILGPLTLGRKHKEVFLGRDIAEDRNYSEEIAYTIDKEVRAIIDQAYEKAQEIINRYREKLDLLAQRLVAVSYTHLDVYKRQRGGRVEPFIEQILISEKEIQAKVKELGEKISKDYQGEELRVVGLSLIHI